MKKFKRGNLIEILVGHRIWSSKKGNIDISPEDVGRKAIIDEISSNNDYSIVFLDDGNHMAWKHASEMKFLSKGGEYLFKKAKANREKQSKLNKNINYILSKLDGRNLNSESILYLFDLIGYRSSFLRNGEFYSLYSDWALLHPVFLHIKNAKSLKEAKKILTFEGNAIFDVEKVYNKFHKLTKN